MCFWGYSELVTRRPMVDRLRIRLAWNIHGLVINMAVMAAHHYERFIATFLIHYTDSINLTPVFPRE